jgi:hypothetical protein
MERPHNHSEVVATIRHYLYDDFRKSDIKEIVRNSFPGIEDSEFESYFSEAFTSM